MFGTATITLGIDPHSSCYCSVQISYKEENICSIPLPRCALLTFNHSLHNLRDTVYDIGW